MELERGYVLAGEIGNTDLKALASAFMARCHRLLGDSGGAEKKLSQALALGCTSPAVQFRIAWMAGESAESIRRYEMALTNYEEANQAKLAYGSCEVILDVRQGDTFLAAGEFQLAWECYMATLSRTQTDNIYPYETALLEFGLAQIAEHDKNWRSARDLACQAKQRLDRLRMKYTVRPKVERFLAKVEPKAK